MIISRKPWILVVVVVAVCIVTALPTRGGNIALSTPDPLTTTVTVDGSGNYWQMDGAIFTDNILDINSGGVLEILTPQWETIISQSNGTNHTINLNLGGLIDTSSASGAGGWFWIGNTVGNHGILNLNSGTFILGQWLDNTNRFNQIISHAVQWIIDSEWFWDP